MNPTEAVALAGYMRAHFPSQPIDEYTSDALHESLEPYSLDDCRAAVLAIARRTHDHAERPKWCSPTDVYAEVRRQRADRLEGVVIEPPSGADPDDVAGYIRWLHGARQAIADGLPAPVFETSALPRRDVISELGTVRSVDEALGDGPRKAREQAQAARYAALAARKPEPEPLLGPDDITREPTPERHPAAATDALAACETTATEESANV